VEVVTRYFHTGHLIGSVKDTTRDGISDADVESGMKCMKIKKKSQTNPTNQLLEQKKVI